MAERMRSRAVAKYADPITLLETQTVDEVRGIERKIRHDIEWKKEEMRDLVGERYRDLISAADSINEMKACAEKIGSAVSSLHIDIQSLRDVHSQMGSRLSVSSKTTVNEKHVLYEVACKIKLLLAVPGKIWFYLDHRDYLRAALLFLLAKHVHSCLQYDSQTGEQVLRMFPVITRQWAAISHFKLAILQGCKLILADHSKSDVDVSNALCAIILLEDKTQRQVFQEFLVARMYTIQENSAVRNQISNIVRQIHNTVFQIISIFCPSNPVGDASNILFSTLIGTVQGSVIEQLGLDEFHALKTHLPKSITEFTPVLKEQNVPLTREHLKGSCDKWLTACLANVRTHVTDLLGFVGSIKGLTSVRDAVWQVLLQDERMKHWSAVCAELFTKQTNIWTDELALLFTIRFKTIISDQFSDLLQSMENQLLSVRDGFAVPDHSGALHKDLNVNEFIWTDEASDLPANSAWVPSSSKTFVDGGGLFMKSHGFTPLVQVLCKSANDRLATLLADFELYQHMDEYREDKLPIAVEHEEICTKVAVFICDSSFQCVTRLIDIVNNALEEYRSNVTSQISRADGFNSLSKFSWVLMLARFCSALPLLWPELEKCMSLGAAASEMTGSSHKSLTKSLRSQGRQQTTLWLQTIHLLASCSQQCYNVWCAALEDCVYQQLQRFLISTDVTQKVENITRWDEVEIEEDGEDGACVTSTIQVPMQVTCCLQKVLYDVCKEINRVGSHALDRESQTELIASVVLKLLRVYSEALTMKEGFSHQNVALQYMFDIWFVTGLLRWKSSSQAEQVEQAMTSLLDRLQSLVDPFDLDVFTPHMQRHVNLQRARNLVLLGAIADSEKTFFASARQPHSSRPEQHNVLPLYTSSLTRFPLLPLSQDTGAQISRSTTSHMTPAIHKVSAESKQLKAAQSEPALKSSSSFYDKLGSMVQSMKF